MPSNAASQLGDWGGAKTRECSGPANLSHWSASKPTSIIVTMAGTGLARSRTRSIWPESRWRSILSPVMARITGSQRAVAAGVNHGRRRRLYSWNAEPSISEGIAPVTPLRGNGDAPELLAQAGTIEVVFGRERFGSRPQRRTRSCDVTTQYPPWAGVCATGHDLRNRACVDSGSHSSSGRWWS